MWIRSLLSCAGVLGACGIVLGAAGAHAGGGDLARLSALFLLVHAAAIVGLASYATQAQRRWLICAVATILAIGVGAFSADLAMMAFQGRHPVSHLAPFGGVLLIIGWIGISIVPWLEGV